MTLSLFAFPARPHDFAVTKAGVYLDECVFLLDFSRPLEEVRWLGAINRWLGPVVALLVPVVHYGETNGAYVIGVRRGQPYFADILKLWAEHRCTPRTTESEAVDGLQIVADFGRHFYEDCR